MPRPTVDMMRNYHRMEGPPPQYTIKNILTNVESEESGKTVPEAIVVESDDGLHDAILTFAELRKRMLLRAKQEAKGNGNPHAETIGMTSHHSRTSGGRAQQIERQAVLRIFAHARSHRQP